MCIPKKEAESSPFATNFQVLLLLVSGRVYLHVYIGAWFELFFWNCLNLFFLFPSIEHANLRIMIDVLYCLNLKQ